MNASTLDLHEKMIETFNRNREYIELHGAIIRYQKENGIQGFDFIKEVELISSKGNVYHIYFRGTDPIPCSNGDFERLKEANDTHILRMRATVAGAEAWIPESFKEQVLALDEKNKDTIFLRCVQSIQTVKEQLGGG